MKFLKKNKFTIIAIILFIGLVILGVQVKNLLVPDEGKAVYGDRLDDIEENKLDSSLFTTIKEELMTDKKVLNVGHEVHGKIINLIITISDDVSVLDAKEIANSTIPLFENDELSFYTLQVYMVKEDKTLNNFPILGYKGVKSKELIFTKDREITSEEDNEKE